MIIILGILLAIAIPSYLSFRDRANNSAAQANVRAAVPAVEAWNADHNTGYTGVTLAKVKASYDAGIKGVSIYGQPPPPTASPPGRNRQHLLQVRPRQRHHDHQGRRLLTSSPNGRGKPRPPPWSGGRHPSRDPGRYREAPQFLVRRSPSLWERMRKRGGGSP